MSGMLIQSKEFLTEVLKRIDNLCLHDCASGKQIIIDDKLKKVIRNYYQDELLSEEMKLRKI